MAKPQNVATETTKKVIAISTFILVTLFKYQNGKFIFKNRSMAIKAKSPSEMVGNVKSPKTANWNIDRSEPLQG